MSSKGGPTFKKRKKTLNSNNLATRLDQGLFSYYHSSHFLLGFGIELLHFKIQFLVRISGTCKLENKLMRNQMGLTITM